MSLRASTPALLMAFAVGVLIVVPSAQGGDASPDKPVRGEVAFESSLDSPAERSGWSEAPFTRWVDGPRDGTALRAIVAEGDRKGGAMVRLPFDLTRYRGAQAPLRVPRARRYLSDCIELFEEYGWDWTYHAYRARDGWSVEHGPDPKDHRPAAEPTDRMKLLLGWFAKNEKPGR